MINFIRISIFLVFLFNHLNATEKFILLTNDPSDKDKTLYTIVHTNDRVKRDILFWPPSEIDKNQISCGYNVYVKLNTCSYLTECRALSSCLESLHCPLNVKSSGGLVLNLLHLLGLNNCPIIDRQNNQLCTNDKRVAILHKLLTYWTKNNDDNYCNTISNLINEVKRVVEEYCPLNLTEVESLLKNYSCSNIKNSTINNFNQNDHFHQQLSTGNVNEQSTTFSSQIAYIDEDNDLKFMNIDKSLHNSSEQTVYTNDHQYYNVSYIIPKSDSAIPKYVIVDDKQFTRIHALSNRHRSAFGINLKFSFPFYGHLITKVLVATGGFIYTGDLLHSALIGSTQYIAPFMANFDASLGNNETDISYFDNGTHFVCSWNKIYLQDQQDAGPFTFQAILQNTGNIYFNYFNIPNIKVSNANHAHRIGLSDAFMSQHSTNEHIVRVITLYDKINLDREKIKNGVSILFDMDQTCNTFTDCTSCLANRGKRYNCSWCDDIQKCSDGYDRSRQQWIRAQCHHLALKDTCPNSAEDVYDGNHFSPSKSPSLAYAKYSSEKYTPIPRPYSLFQTFRTIIITLLLSVLILSLSALGVTYLYAYRNPTSPVGMWLLEHRPSHYIARFKRFTGSN